MPLARTVAARLPSATWPVGRRALCAWKGLGDARFTARTGVELPPADLRFFVGSVDRERYVEIGRRCAADIVAGLGSIGRRWSDFDRALDFGCGTGRTLAALPGGGPTIIGADRHERCIAWCREHLPGTFIRNDRLPPLEIDDGAVDLAFAVSVFTHLHDDEQFAWLAELGRVVRPGGVLLASVHGRSTHGVLTADEAAELEREGIVTRPARALHGVFDDYVNTYHDERYIRERWSEWFDVAAYLPRGMNDHQDLVVLGRR